METWRSVIGFEGYYEVSDQGRVRSQPRQGTDGRVLSITPSEPCGYMRVRLYRDGRGSAKKVHRLVLEAFVGAAPQGADACHNNGQRSDNRLTNLRWDTRQANVADSRTHGTIARGERNGHAKLTREKVAELRALRAAGASYKAISVRFGVSRETARSAAIGATWA